MPPLCRATSAAGEPSANVVTAALDQLTDAAVRTRLAAEPGFAVLPPPLAGQLTDRWAAALTGEDGEVKVDARDAAKAAQLTFALWAWQDAAQEPPGPVRTCFRLTEPGQDAEDGSWPPSTWRCRFDPPPDDPSLMLPAADIWAGGTADGWAAAGISFPEEDLLAGLGRASRLFPELDTELQGAAPASVDLDTRGALRFLKETGPLLAGAGFGVLLPDWVRRSRLGLKLTTRSRTAAGPGSVTAPSFSLSDLVDFRYELAVGDQTLDPDELAELARLKVPLVRLRGQWVELDERHLKAALYFLERGGAGAMQRRRRAARWARRRRRGPAADRGGRRRLARRPAFWPRRQPARADEARPRLSAASCGPTRSAAWPGCRSSASSASAPCWPTTWAWARRRRRWPCCRPSATAGRASRADPADLPDVGGRQLAAGGGAVHARPDGARASRRGPARRARARRGARGSRSGHHHLRRRHQGPRGAGAGAVGAGGLRRGAEHQERGHPAGAGGAGDPGRIADRADRHAGGEPADRALVDHGVHQPRPARPGREVPAAVRDPDRAQRRRRPRPTSSSG